MPFHDIDVAELAAWLEGHGRETLWAVDGDDRLAGQVAAPCTGEDLAAALRSRGGRIRVFDPPDVRLVAGEAVSSANLDKVAERDDDSLSFRLAWVLGDQAVGEQWLLVEDVLAKQAENG